MSAKRIEMFKIHREAVIPQSVEQLRQLVKPGDEDVLRTTWNFCSMKSTEVLTNLADVIDEALFCFSDYAMSPDGVMAILAEAQDILKRGAKLIASINGEENEKG